jgi:hypothetical protein
MPASIHEEHLPALRAAGWDDLRDHERDWVASRIARLDQRDRVGGAGAGPASTNNPGALRSNEYGAAGDLASFGSPEQGYRALCDASRRAGFRLGAALPASLPVDPPEVFERAGDLLDRSAAACALARTVRDLRQTWESLDRIGVGRAVLPEARPEALRWRRFRDAWDSGELGDPSEPGWYARVGSAARALAEDANQILRAGLWGEDSPERARLRKIREILGQYRAKVETSGAGKTVQVLDQFTCPNCGSHEFGSVQEQAAPLLLMRYCHGRAGERGDEACSFSWPDTDDPKYFTRRDLGISGAGAAGGHQEISRKIEEVAALERDAERLSAPVWHAPGDLGALEIRVGIAVGWSWFGAPSDEAKATFSQLMHDWADFEKDGVPGKYPWLKETYLFWLDFKEQWLAEKADVTVLSSVVADANRVRRDIADALQKRADAEARKAAEAEAKAKTAMTAEQAAAAKAEAEAAKQRAEDAQRAAEATKKTADITAPDVTQLSDRLRAASDPLRYLAEETSRTAAAWAQAIAEVGKKIGDSIGTWWSAIPWQTKAGGAAVLGLGTYAALRR